jgi:hypothetical protein
MVGRGDVKNTQGSRRDRTCEVIGYRWYSGEFVGQGTDSQIDRPNTEDTIDA